MIVPDDGSMIRLSHTSALEPVTGSLLLTFSVTRFLKKLFPIQLKTVRVISFLLGSFSISFIL